MSKLLLSGLLCAALLGCSSPPKLSEPSGVWVDVNPVISSTYSGGNNAIQKK